MINKSVHCYCLLPLCVALAGCGSSSSSIPNLLPENNLLEDSSNFYAVSATSLEADGAAGVETYALIESVLGNGAIEAPDLYGDDNHQGETHIIESEDAQVGNYFTFLIHRDEDKERDTGKLDRQRNEIKVYGNSKDMLKGYQDSTFEYSWKFKVGDDLAVTSHFNHLFQLKAVGEGDISNPLLTITANTRSGVSGLEIRHVGYGSDGDADQSTTLAHTSYEGIDWATQIQGQWLEVVVRSTFSEQGSLYMTITPLGEVQPLVEISESNIELWRAGSDADSGDFIRPKWGIYRYTLGVTEQLNENDGVSFANFMITELSLVSTST